MSSVDEAVTKQSLQTLLIKRANKREVVGILRVNFEKSRKSVISLLLHIFAVLSITKQKHQD